MLSHALAPDAEMRLLEPWQAEEFAAHVAAAQDHLAEWLPWALTTAEPEGAARFLQRYADKQAQGEGRVCGIWVADKLAGGLMFRIWDTWAATCELGVWLAPEAVGRGLMTKAARAMIDWAIVDRGMHRVEWRCVPQNTRSSAVAKRLGMTMEGTLRQCFPHRETRFDAEVWAVLAHEWAILTA